MIFFSLLSECPVRFGLIFALVKLRQPREANLFDFDAYFSALRAFVAGERVSLYKTRRGVERSGVAPFYNGTAIHSTNAIVFRKI